MPCHGKIIVIKRSGVDGTHFPLTAATCMFGRKSECDIRIQLPHVSKEHCKVEVRENGEVFVTNLSSVNPTRLNGNALRQPVHLKHGDIITIIDRSFRFESPRSQKQMRRSAGLDSENFKIFASNQSEDTSETVRIESISTSKVQRKSEGNVTRTTHTRRSLQTSSSEAKKDQSPFGELYEMLKSKVESRKKENVQTPVKESSSLKNLTIKRNFQAETVSQSPATSRRGSRRSQSSDSATVQSKDAKVEPRAVSADRVREQSKSPSKGPRNSLTKQKQGRAVEGNSPVISTKSLQSNSTHTDVAQDHVQTPRRRSGKQVSDSQEQEASIVSPEKPSPRRSTSTEKIQAVGLVSSPAGSGHRRSRGQSVPHPTGIENQENSPLPGQSPRGRRSSSKDQTKGTPNKPVETEEKVNDVQGLATRKSPKKRRSDELGLTEPPLKRKRVSFGGHLSPELFDKRLPPNSPLKKGATPARRSLSLNSPRTVIRKSFGLRQTAIKEVFELPSTRRASSPLVRSTSGPARSPLPKGSSDAVTAEISVSSPKRRASAVHKKSPSKSPLSVAITPGKQSQNKGSPFKTPSLTPLRTSPSTLSPIIPPSKTPVKRTSVKSEPITPAKRSSISKLSDSAKKSPVKSLPLTPVGISSATTSSTKRSRSPTSVKKSPIKSEAPTPGKLSTPGKRSPATSPSTIPAKKSSKLSSPGKGSPGRPPSTTPAKKSPAKLASPSKRSPGRSPSTAPAKKSPAKLASPGKRSPGRSPSITPAKKSPAKLASPGKRSPGRPPSTTPAKKSPAKLASPGKSSPGRSPSTTPAKKSLAKLASPGKRSPGRPPSTTPAKKSPAKLGSPGKRSPGRPPSTTPAKKSPAKLTSPGKRSPGRSPSTTPAKKSPAKLGSPGKRSPGRPPSTTPAKKSPAKLTSPGKRLPGRPPSTTPAKKSPAKLTSPGKRSPGRPPSTTPAKKSPAKLVTPGKRSPGRPPSTTPAKKSPAKLVTPGKTSPGKSQSKTPVKKSPVKLSTPARSSPFAKSTRTPTPVKLTKFPASAKKSPVLTSPAKRSPSTPYTKGRFSVSRVTTPPQVVENISEVLVAQTPKQSRKSLTSKKTPLRRSRKLDAFEILRARRRSGASEANLLVAKSWADVVKKGVTKPQKKIDKPTRKAVAAKKKPKPKTPARRVKDLYSTGHADSPATILVGRAHTRTLNLTGYVPKVVRNEAVKLNPAHDESFTGMAELFSTPVNAKQRRSSRYDESKAGTPKSTVEMSVVQTPEEAGEMVVSPLNSPVTTQRKRYGRDAVSKFLEASVSPELSNINSSESAEQEASKSSKDNRKSVGLTGVKRIMRTPKQKGKPVTDPHALRKLLKTPKEAESTQAYTRRSAKLEVLGIAQLMKTPKQKGEPVEDMLGIKRILKTPRQKGEPVEAYTAVKRIMQTPKERGEPVEDMVGIKRLMQTPKEKGEPVEDMLGIKRLMKTPKARGQPVEGIDISHLMSTPADSTQSSENTRPIEEIFGMKNLVKTPPKKSAAEQALTTNPKNASEARRSLEASSKTLAKRGRPSKRLSLPAETATTVNEVQKTMAVAESEIAQESGVQRISSDIKSAHKKGRPSKNIPALPASEMPKESAVIPEVTSPSLRGRPRTTPEVRKEFPVSDVAVTSPSRRGRPRSTVLSPVADNVTSQPNVGSILHVQTDSVSDEVSSPSRRGRPRSVAAVQESVTEVTSPTQRGRASATVAKASLPASEEMTSTHGGRRSATFKAAEESPLTSQEITSPTRRGRPSNTAAVVQDVASTVEINSPTRRGKPSAASEVGKAPLLGSSEQIISPTRRGRPSVAPSELAPIEKLTSPSRRGRASAATGEVKDSLQAASVTVTSPSRRGRPSITVEGAKESDKTADAEMASPSHRGKPRSPPEEPKESLTVSDARVISPSRRGRSVGATKESVPIANEVTSQTRRGRSVEVAKESVLVTNAVTLLTRRGRSVEAAKESVPVANEVTSPKRRGRLQTIETVLKELEPATDGKVNSRERSRSTEDVSKESASVAEVTLQPRRGKSRDPVEVPKDSATVTKAVVTSPAHTKVSKSTVELHKESSVDKETPPVSEVTSPRRGRPKASAKLPKESVVVTEEASTTRRGRAKITADVPEKFTDLSQTRRGRAKAKTDLPVVPVPAASGDLTSTRRGRPKAAAVTKEPVPEESGDVTSPTRRGRMKAAEEPKAASSDVTSPTRRGRPKPTEVPKEPVPAASDITSPTHKGRSKAVAVPKVPISTASNVSFSTKRGRPKTTNLSEKPITVSDNEATSPPHGAVLQNSEPKESLPVSVEVMSPKRRGRPARSTEKKTDFPSETLDDANKVTGKTDKRAVNRRAAKNPKQNVEILQESEVTQPVESNTTAVQPPAPSRRGRGRKAVQNEPPTAAEEPQSSLEVSQKAELSVNRSPANKPVARRGGRRRNEEQLADIADSKQETKRRAQAKSKDETSKTADVPEQAKSPAAKYLKISEAKHQKDLQPEPPVAEPPKNIRGRQSRAAQESSTETSISETTDLPQKRTPTKGRSGRRDTSNVSAAQKEQQESSAPVSKQRGRRKNQENTNKTTQVLTEPTTARATRGVRGLPDGEQPQPAAEMKGKTARSKERPSQAKSVQWHPLLTTDGNVESTEEAEESITEVPTRGARSKGRTKADALEPVPAKRPRRESPDKSEPPAISAANPASSVADISVTKGRRGRKAAIPQEQLEEGKSLNVQSSSVDTAKSLGRPALHPARGRKAAASTKALDSVKNEVAVEVSTSRGKRSAAASTAPAQSTSPSPAKPKNQKKGSLPKESNNEAEEVAPKPGRGVKRGKPSTETQSGANATASNADTENAAPVRGKRNARSTKAEKDKPTEESLVEKQIVSSPAKRRKTAAATSVTTARGKSKQTSKAEKVEPPVAARGRAATRSRN